MSQPGKFVTMFDYSSLYFVVGGRLDVENGGKRVSWWGGGRPEAGRKRTEKILNLMEEFCFTVLGKLLKGG